MTLEESNTRLCLMRAFAGECQAQTRYTLAASRMKALRLPVLERLFTFTAEQEKEHAELFYRRLTPLSGQNIAIGAEYPVSGFEDAADLLAAARQGELQESEHDYAMFADTARREGFSDIAALFDGVARVEKTHADRFGRYLSLLTDGALFRENGDIAWLCLNCGHVHYGPAAPETCPVCRHEQGWFIRQIV